MAIYRVQGPDGKIHRFEGPEGASQEDVVAQAQKQFGGDQPEEAPAPSDTGGADTEGVDTNIPMPKMPEKPTSQASGFMQSFTRPVRNADQWIGKAAEAAGVDTGYQKRVQNYDATTEDWNRQTKPGFMGEVAGTALATAPVLLATRNPWLLGGAGGAMESKSDTVGGVAADAGVGALAGKVGDVALRTAGSVIAPRFRETVNRMLARGVRLTPGQIMGGSLHKLEDASTSTPFLGDVVSSSQRRGLEDFNKAVVNESLTPIRTKLPENIEAGHDSIKFAQKALGDAYDNILPQITVRAPRLGTAAYNDLQNLLGNVASMSADHAKMFADVFNKEIKNNLWSVNSRGVITAKSMTGHTLKDVEEVLNKEINDFAHSPNPHDRRYSDAVRELQTQVREWAADSSPAAAARLRAINQGYANLTRAELAAAPARKGVFTPDQFRSATRAADKSVRKRISAAGDARMQTMAEDASDTLARTLGESGTAPRWAVNSAAGAALGGGIHFGMINPMAAGALGAMLAPYTRAGGAVFRAAIRRPTGAAAVRGAVEKAAPAATAAAQTEVSRSRRGIKPPED